MYKKLFWILLIAVSIQYSCDETNYARAVRKDSKKIFLLHKQFLRSFEFGGIITSKKNCDSCVVNKYQLSIRIVSGKVDSISFPDKSFQPYYFFENDSDLHLSVPKKIFDTAEVGIAISKKANSDELICQNKMFSFLSGDRSTWFY